MVWGCFSARGASKLKIINGNSNSEKYCEILEDIMIPFGASAYNGDWRFQPYNAIMHYSSLNNEFLIDMVVSALNWPACSPDLNPIKNICGYTCAFSLQGFWTTWYIRRSERGDRNCLGQYWFNSIEKCWQIHFLDATMKWSRRRVDLQITSCLI